MKMLNKFPLIARASDICRIQLVLSLLLPLKAETFKYFDNVNFLCEQLSLMCKSTMNYSYDYLAFSSLLHNVSFHAGYRFFRNSGRFILPCYTTIRKLTLDSSMSPSGKQSEDSFLFYVHQKFESLSSLDVTVMLLVDEIHLKA